MSATRLEGAEDAADRQPIGRHADPVIVVRGAEDAGDEDEADNHIKPFFHDFAVGAGQPNQQIREKAALNHFPHAFHPQVDRPPAVEDGHGVVFVFEQRRQVQHRGEAEAEHQHALGRGEAARLPDRHADVVEEQQHADDDHDLVGQRLFEQLVARAIPEQVADDGGHAHQRPQDELDVGELDAMKLGARFVRHHPVRGAHEARQHPYDQQIGMDDFRNVEGKDVEQRVGAQVFGGR